MHHQYSGQKHRSHHPGDSLSRGLGWFSIALGVVELAAPHAVARACGMQPGHAGLVRLYGLREIATGIGILRARNAAPWLWARVGGDLLDAGTLAAVADRHHAPGMVRAGAALANVTAITALDVYAAQTYKQPHDRREGVDYADYSDRSGFSRTPQEMRGEAMKDFEVPRDMRTPEALRAYGRPDRAAVGATAPTLEQRAADVVAPQGLVEKG